MSNSSMMPYLPPTGLDRPIPIERFLPPCPAGIIEQVVGSSVDDFVLDPFGSNPLLPTQLAQCGKRVLVTCNNPILAFCMKQLCKPAKKEEFLSAIAGLASQKRGEERLETHIKSLYQTRCTICHQEIQASGFLWRRGETTPFARIYRCPNCGDEGERAITEDDILRLQPIIRGEKVHRARAISKVIKENEEDRPAVEEALKVYNSRAIYVLFTLLNKIEGMEIDPNGKEKLFALMISMLDAGTSLWPWPPSLDSPHQLTLPAEYLEKNLWSELEAAVNLWTQPAQSVEYSLWPKLPSHAGICLFEGPVRSIKELPESAKIARMICLPPRPNQAFWTLSALWSAWLWADESGTNFRNVLARRRFDWHWQTHALHQALEKAVSLCQTEAPVFIQIGEPSAAMTLATAVATRTSGLHFSGLAYRSVIDGLQLYFQTKKEPPPVRTVNLQSICRNAIRDTLLNLGEPCEYLRLYTAAIAAAIQSDGLPGTIEEYTTEKSSEFQGMLARLFSDRAFLRRFDVSSQDFESGKWWLANSESTQIPLADRVEIEIVRLLQQKKTLPGAEVSQQIYQFFTGLLTPPAELVEYCLSSYASWEPFSQTWQLRKNEFTANRVADIDRATKTVISLGSKLGFETEQNSFISWKIKGQEQYRFNFSAAALLAKNIPPESDVDLQQVFVFPGSRSGLLKYKLLRDPYLHERTLNNWHFLKFRALFNLAGRNDLTPSLWAMLLDSDPISLEETMQLRMFG